MASLAQNRDLTTKIRLTLIAEEVDTTKEAIKWAKNVARITMATSLSTFLFLTAKTWNNHLQQRNQIIQAAAAITIVVDILLNSICTALLSGLAGPRLETQLKSHDAGS